MMGPGFAEAAGRQMARIILAIAVCSALTGAGVVALMWWLR